MRSSGAMNPSSDIVTLKNTFPAITRSGIGAIVSRTTGVGAYGSRS
jgi:hypothetical protein